MTEPSARRGDPLLELTHLGGQRGLVADRGGHPAQKRGDLRACLDEAEDVVDEEEDVLALLAEVLGHRQPRERHAEACARRLVHLAEDERGLVDHPGLGHLQIEVIPLARPLPDPGKDREAGVLLGDRADQLLDQDRLADARAAEEPDLPALDVRGEEIDDLDAGLEDLNRRLQVLERGRVPVDRPALHVLELLVAIVDRVPEDVEQASQCRLSDRDADRRPEILDVDAAGETVRRVHGDCANAVVSEVLLDLRDQIDLGAAFLAGHLDSQSVVDLREIAGEDGVEDDASDFDDFADTCRRLSVLGHGTPGSGGSGRSLASCCAQPRSDPVGGIGGTPLVVGVR